ncbi:cytochrome b-c1 complex subunit 6, mitochondrial [Strongylocentrotus purpuratus]|uniref:Ubiquinol-cytochrome C reductase hinge domain-containing protein n=1 Tax=Strongylocentrotus purpuratus TaxID=7668 RepID=A0A7M7RGM2_STRPU|nr:cytochrome b-c1 complex subunit 6, mitochondrial [Strongylocentrotus purpuratus]|eukprot:XP_795093.3 PREDICTED: cytochrome b-c1 complex subunit 6, mitochondrial [Strongylocentrotus purpuratus]
MQDVTEITEIIMALEDEQIMAGNPPEDEEEEEEEEEEEDEDLVDPRDKIREDCEATGHCAALKETFDACTDRVSAKSNTEETCTEEFFDFLHCVDHCTAPQTFKHYK